MNVESGGRKKVSCLMLTSATRSQFARRAIECFDAQSYPERELVIVSRDDVSQLGRPFHRAPAELTLGDLRNYAVARAAGEYVATWDDDDWHHPERISRQISALEDSPHADASTLTRVVLAWPARARYAVSKARKRGLEGTIVARRWSMPCYPSINLREDAHLLHNIDVATLDVPDLYAYVVHGGNTSPAQIFEGLFDGSADLPSDEVAIMRLRLGAPP